MACHTPKKPNIKQANLMRIRFEVSRSGLVVKNTYHRSPALGSPVGSDSNKYRNVYVAGRVFYVHHIVWLLTYNKWPEQPLDHIDGNKYNNTPENLRLLNSKENSRSYAKNYGSTCYRGVQEVRGRYVARVNVGGVITQIGTYGTPEEAAVVRDLYVYEELGWPWEGLSTLGKWAAGYYHQSQANSVNLEGF